MPFFVYVLRNPGGTIYIGFTTNLDKRVRQHQEDQAGWTRGRGPWEIVHYETFTDRSDAIRRERNLKRGRTNQDLRRRFSRSGE